MKIKSFLRTYWAVILSLSIPIAWAADVAISALSAGTTIAGTEAIPMVQSGVTVKTTPSAIRTYMLGTASTWTAAQTFVAPLLGTPASGVATNLTGTASGLTAGNVTTNANLTGPITSTGNATAVGAQTGTGSTFVMQTAPTLNTTTLAKLTTLTGNSTDWQLDADTTAGTLYIGNTGNKRFAIDWSDNVRMGASLIFGWASAGGASNAADTGVARNAAGVVGVNNGTACSAAAANCRDAKSRHLLAAGTAPTVAGSCGTSPSIAGRDTAMTITAGTVAPTSCTVTFGTAYANAPVCTANAQTTTTALNVATTTTTVIVSAAALTVSEKIQVICIGY